MKSTLKKINLICLIIICLNLGQAFAQEEQTTTYEKKKNELLAQIWPKYGRTAAAYAESWDERTYTEILATAEAADIAAALLGFYSDEMNAAKWYAQELTKIQHLRTNIDNQREKELQLKHDRIKAQEEFEKTDLGKIYKGINLKFATWNSKGEFEKEEDFLQRIKNESKSAFIEICIEEIIRLIQQYDVDYKLEKHLSEYDTNSESFKISCALNGFNWTSQINIPLSKAPKFKEDWYYINFNADNYDWGLIGKSLCPTKLSLNFKDVNYELQVPLEDRFDIKIYFDSLNIDNEVLKGETFNFSDAKKLNDVAFKNYCNKLDSLFNDFNKRLLTNPYNIDQMILASYQKMEKTNNLKETFNTCQRSLESDFNSVNQSFEIDLLRSNKSEYCRIFYSINPDKQASADKLYLECKCKYSDRTRFDLDYIQDKIYLCECRKNAYQSNKDLFESKEEFDKYYDLGGDIFEKEIVIREFNKDVKTIESLNLKGAASEEEKNAGGKELLNSLTGVNLTTDNSKTDLNKSYVKAIAIYVNKTYYGDVIDYFISVNKDLKKEWEKNSVFFKNSVDFYEAYVSGNYSKILKSNKK